jgi:hypothetical protein
MNKEKVKDTVEKMFGMLDKMDTYEEVLAVVDDFNDSAWKYFREYKKHMGYTEERADFERARHEYRSALESAMLFEGEENIEAFLAQIDSAETKKFLEVIRAITFCEFEFENDSEPMVRVTSGLRSNEVVFPALVLRDGTVQYTEVNADD